MKSIALAAFHALACGISLAERMRLWPRAAALAQLLALVFLAVVLVTCGIGAGVLAVWLVVT